MLTIVDIMEISRIICFTVMEYIFGLMNQNMLDNSLLIKNMEKVYMSGTMAVNFRVDGTKDYDKARESIRFKTVIKEKVYGELIKELNG